MITLRSMPNTEHKDKPFIHVAVGVIESSDQKILLAKRPLDKHQGGLWEFPGGKLDKSEDTLAALKRELMEELNLAVGSARPFIHIHHDYDDISVLLDVYKVLVWQGQAQGLEGQEIRWVEKNSLKNYRFPEANQPIIKALLTPEKYCITPEYIDSSNQYLQRLEKILSEGNLWLQFRSFQCQDITIEQLFSETQKLAKKHQIPLILNSSLHKKNPDYENQHLTSNDLINIEESIRLNPKQIIGASCHSIDEIEKAEALGVNYILLGPVKKTLSHPEREVLGWPRFEELIERIKIPVFAIGGLNTRDLASAHRYGAQGIAMIRGYWAD